MLFKKFAKTSKGLFWKKMFRIKMFQVVELRAFFWKKMFRINMLQEVGQILHKFLSSNFFDNNVMFL